jgi:phospholipid/cholesterol/gamma-HCH transport system substrate-binding protein
VRRLLHRLLRPIALVATLAVLAAGCGGPEPVVVQAEFDDVVDLVTQAPVYTADVRVGTVTDIELTDDNRARVTMEVRPDTGLPAEVEAVLLQTSLLGERAVELRPVGGGGRLASGEIERTEVMTDLEELVTTGNELLAFIAADRLNAAVHAGAVTFGGRGGLLGQVITDVETFAGRFDRDSDEILRLLDNFDQLLGTLSSEAETNAAAIEALARSNAALRQEDERLLDSLEDLRELAVVGERMLRHNRRQLDEFFAQLEVILKAVTGVEGALQGLLTWLPRHNLHVPNAQLLEFVQIWQDTIVCGSESEERDNPAKSCRPPNPGRSNTPPPGTRTAACDDEGDCPRGHRIRNEPNDFGEDADEDRGEDHETYPYPPQDRERRRRDEEGPS